MAIVAYHLDIIFLLIACELRSNFPKNWYRTARVSATTPYTRDRLAQGIPAFRTMTVSLHSRKRPDRHIDDPPFSR